MQLVEQGKLSLDEPIGKLLPDLASPQVLEGFDAKGEPKLRPATEADHAAASDDPHRRLRLRHVERRHGKYLEKTGTPGIISCQNAALKTPIMTDPGTRWEYGTNIDFVGKAVEAVSGKKLDAYLRDNLFAPLGMNDTGFKITRLHAQAAGRHACPRRGGPGAVPVRDGADPGIPYGRRRPLRHGGRLHQVHPDDPQQGQRQRQPDA